MPTETARNVLSELKRMPDLPVPVLTWEVKDGLDATDDPAVWVWAYIEPEGADADKRRRLKAAVRGRVREMTDGLWAYVLIRSADETEGVA